MISLISIEKANAEINDSLFMTVGNKAITQSDVVNEIKLILILNNETYSDEKRDGLHQAAIKSIINRNIKQIEIDKHEFYDFNENDWINYETGSILTNYSPTFALAELLNSINHEAS